MDAGSHLLELHVLRETRTLEAFPQSRHGQLDPLGLLLFGYCGAHGWFIASKNLA